eukprot:1901881-Rhodomonas_salina.1
MQPDPGSTIFSPPYSPSQYSLPRKIHPKASSTDTAARKLREGRYPSQNQLRRPAPLVQAILQTKVFAFDSAWKLTDQALRCLFAQRSSEFEIPLTLPPQSFLGQYRTSHSVPRTVEHKRSRDPELHCTLPQYWAARRRIAPHPRVTRPELQQPATVLHLLRPRAARAYDCPPRTAPLQRQQALDTPVLRVSTPSCSTEMAHADVQYGHGRSRRVGDSVASVPDMA